MRDRAPLVNAGTWAARIALVGVTVSAVAFAIAFSQSLTARAADAAYEPAPWYDLAHRLGTSWGIGCLVLATLLILLDAHRHRPRSATILSGQPGRSIRPAKGGKRKAVR